MFASTCCLALEMAGRCLPAKAGVFRKYWKVGMLHKCQVDICLHMLVCFANARSIVGC